jgi:hypothetical protein
METRGRFDFATFIFGKIKKKMCAHRASLIEESSWIANEI